jgi:hypothetical protein
LAGDQQDVNWMKSGGMLNTPQLQGPCCIGVKTSGVISFWEFWVSGTRGHRSLKKFSPPPGASFTPLTPVFIIGQE